MNTKIRVLIADDHPVLRSGLISILNNHEDIEVVAQASNGKKALELILTNTIDVAALDIEMPKMSGLEVARLTAKNKEASKTKIVFLTMYKDEDIFNEALDAGAYGYVLKENAVENIVDCIRSVSIGKYFLSPTISQYLINRETKLRGLKSQNPSVNDLTHSERKILKLIAEEKTSKEIAEILFISFKTVENHRSNISKKLNLKGSHSLVKFAIQNKSLI